MSKNLYSRFYSMQTDKTTESDSVDPMKSVPINFTELSLGDPPPSSQTPLLAQAAVHRIWTEEEKREEMNYVTTQFHEGDIITISLQAGKVIDSKIPSAGPTAMKLVSLDSKTNTNVERNFFWMDTFGSEFQCYRDRVLNPRTDTFGFKHPEMVLALADYIAKNIRDNGTIPIKADLGAAVGHPLYASTESDNAAYEKWSITHKQRTDWLRDVPTGDMFNQYVYQAIAVAMGDADFCGPSSTIQDAITKFTSSDEDASLYKDFQTVVKAVTPLLDPTDVADILTFTQLTSPPLGIPLRTIRFARGGARVTPAVFNTWVNNLVAAFEVSALSKVNRRQTLEAQIKASVEAGDYVRVATLAAELNSL